MDLVENEISTDLALNDGAIARVNIDGKVVEGNNVEVKKHKSEIAFAYFSGEWTFRGEKE